MINISISKQFELFANNKHICFSCVIFANYELDFVRFVCKTKRHCIDAWFCIATKSPKKEDKSNVQALRVLRRKREKERKWIKIKPTEGRIRARSNIYRCRYIERVIWKSPDLPLTRIHVHTRVHEKRHGPNFVPRRVRRSTIAHKIHRNENITWRSTYLGEASESYDKTGKTTDNCSLKMDPRNIREKILGTLFISIFITYFPSLCFPSLLYFLTSSTRGISARWWCSEISRLSFFVYTLFSIPVPYIHSSIRKQCDNLVHTYIFRSVTSPYLSHEFTYARG